MNAGWQLWFPVVVVVNRSVVRTVIISVVHCCQNECFGNRLLSSSKDLEIKCLRLKWIGCAIVLVLKLGSCGILTPVHGSWWVVLICNLDVLGCRSRRHHHNGRV